MLHVKYHTIQANTVIPVTMSHVKQTDHQEKIRSKAMGLRSVRIKNKQNTHHTKTPL